MTSYNRCQGRVSIYLPMRFIFLLTRLYGTRFDLFHAGSEPCVPILKALPIPSAFLHPVIQSLVDNVSGCLYLYTLACLCGAWSLHTATQSFPSQVFCSNSRAITTRVQTLPYTLFCMSILYKECLLVE
ncbi:hypothetical protein IscW_ISCW002745 [Ixodes scapularis]|uniref:Uncharacterized protein n=1 Tax=Ixodes scapularis TaxID=6945 RepID=B7PCS9_IXOSC|nr:hypothetical protein IscW_ISCW002745 [Ixodes scapularis]|eukprot:XP_002410233.1 hypothetical protein IscW_ISCW002745 [Ixodes scapularis]